MLAFAAGAVIGHVATSRRSTHDVAEAAPESMAPTRATAMPPKPAAPPQDDDLISDLIHAHDLAEGEAQRGHLREVLDKHGVQMVHVQVGDVFDAHRHKAVGREFAPTSSGEPAIHAIVRHGWAVNGRVSRAPEVIVAVPPDAGRDETPPRAR